MTVHRKKEVLLAKNGFRSARRWHLNTLREDRLPPGCLVVALSLNFIVLEKTFAAKPSQKTELWECNEDLYAMLASNVVAPDPVVREGIYRIKH